MSPNGAADELSAQTSRGRAAFVADLAIALFGFVGLTILLYLAGLQHAIPNSDGATVVLEGQSMLAGHLSLSGWALSLDSFWTVDALFYLVGVALFGAHAVLLHLVPAIIGALVIAVGALVASNGLQRRGLITAIAVMVLLLGLPSVAFSSYFLLGPLHVATTLWCLICFYGLRHGRFDRGFGLASAFIALGLLGDAQMLTLGIAPIVVAGVTGSIRQRRLAAGMPALCAVLIGTSLALIVRAIAVAIGTFSINEVAPTASISEMVHNLGYVVSYVPSLLGITSGAFARSGVPAPLGALHVLSLLLLLSAMLVGLYELVRGLIRRRPGDFGASFLDDVVLAALLCGVVTFTKLDGNESLTSARYLTAAIIFATVLAARFAARRVVALRRSQLRLVVPIAGLVACCYGASFGLSFRLANQANPGSRLVSFLRAHHLRVGLGDYWTSSILTVESNGRVVVRPVIDSPQGKVVRYERNSTAQWYAHQRFEFVVYDRALPLVNETEAAATFGRPTQVFDVGIYEVLTWTHPIKVSIDGANA